MKLGYKQTALTEKEWLLNLARSSLIAAVTGDSASPPGAIPEPFLTSGGCFVTLHLDARLRGCIGTLESSAPLWRSVKEMAVQAALHDPRFPPVVPSEIVKIQIEISLLSPLELLVDPTRLILGQEGILLNLRGARAVFLPQVATEQGWDQVTQLEALCRKAGLNASAWRSPEASFQKFTAVVFTEGE